jgi:hypothetical protein
LAEEVGVVDDLAFQQPVELFDVDPSSYPDSLSTLTPRGWLWRG